MQKSPSARRILFGAVAVAFALLAVAPKTSHAKTPPLFIAEVRAGSGVRLGEAFLPGADAAMQPAGIFIGGLLELSVAETPWTSLFAEVFVEAGKAMTFGAALGARVRPTGGGLRLGAAFLYEFVGYGGFGPLVTVGYCVGKKTKFCVDLEGTAFLGGPATSDVERPTARAQLILGAAFDVL